MDMSQPKTAKPATSVTNAAKPATVMPVVVKPMPIVKLTPMAPVATLIQPIPTAALPVPIQAVSVFKSPVKPPVDVTKYYLRWNKEIKAAESSPDYHAYWDRPAELHPDDGWMLYVIPRLHEDSVYAGQQHLLSFKFCWGRGENTYVFPAKPPLVRFQTPIVHPNVSAEGSICLDIIQEIDPMMQKGSKEDTRKHGWSPTYDVGAVVNSIIALLEEPNPSSPFNREANQTYLEYKAGKFTTVQYRTLLREAYERKMLQAHRDLLEKVRRGRRWGDEALIKP
jgi:ubiquitin-protein ligase